MLEPLPPVGGRSGRILLELLPPVGGGVGSDPAGGNRVGSCWNPSPLWGGGRVGSCCNPSPLRGGSGQFVRRIGRPVPRAGGAPMNIDEFNG